MRNFTSRDSVRFTWSHWRLLSDQTVRKGGRMLLFLNSRRTNNDEKDVKTHVHIHSLSVIIWIILIYTLGTECVFYTSLFYSFCNPPQTQSFSCRTLVRFLITDHLSRMCRRKLLNNPMGFSRTVCHHLVRNSDPGPMRRSIHQALFPWQQHCYRLHARRCFN